MAASSSDVTAGDAATAVQYNNLRADALLRNVISGSYTGNDADARNITVGMKCTMVIIGYTGIQWVLIPSNTTVHPYNETSAAKAHINDVANCSIHGTDGFVVSKTNATTNVTSGSNGSGATYYYWCIGEGY